MFPTKTQSTQPFRTGLRAGAGVVLVSFLAACSSGGGGSGDKPDPPRDPKPANLKVSDVKMDVDSIKTGGEITVSDRVENDGEKASEAFELDLFLSKDKTIDSSDTKLGQRKMDAMEPKASREASTKFTIQAKPGTYYIAARATHDGKESTQSDNVAWCKKQLRVDPSEADLLAESLTHRQTRIKRNERVTFELGIRNIGAGRAGAFRVSVYASKKAQITANDELLWSRDVAGLDPNRPLSVSDSFLVKLAPGTWFLGVIADDSQKVDETNETNNMFPSPRQLVIEEPQRFADLTFKSITHGARTVFQGGKLALDGVIENKGDKRAESFRVALYASTDRDIDPKEDELLLERDVSRLDPSSSFSFGRKVEIDLRQGKYFIGGIVDPNGDVTESDEDNNEALSRSFLGELTVYAQPRPDLTVSAFSTPQWTVEKGKTLALHDTVKNLDATTQKHFKVAFYASTKTPVTKSDLFLGHRTVAGLGKGLSSSAKTTVTVKIDAGVYYIAAFADSGDAVSESDENNNMRRWNGKLTVTDPHRLPDLEVSAFTHTPYQVVYKKKQVNLVFTVKNRGNYNVSKPFDVRIYASTSNRLSKSYYLTTVTVHSLGAGRWQSFNRWVSVHLAPKSYWLFAVADYKNDIAESNEHNNERRSGSNHGKLEVLSQADLRPTYFSHNAPHNRVRQGGHVSFSATIQNQGGEHIRDKFYVSVYATTDKHKKGTRVGYWTLNGFQGHYTLKLLALTRQIHLPRGSYYLRLEVDEFDSISESNEHNNIIWYPHRLTVH